MSGILLNPVSVIALDEKIRIVFLGFFFVKASTTTLQPGRSCSEVDAVGSYDEAGS